MVLAQSLVADAVGVFWLVAFALVPGVVASILWTPFLLARRIRSLFAALPPSGSAVPSFVIAGIGGSLPYVAVVAGVIGAVDPEGAAWSNALLGAVVPLSAAYVLGGPVVAALVLPRIGIDWDPTGYGPSTWALSLVASAWYAATLATPIVLMAFVFALPGGY
ncbi:hypothetical protein Hbl1158_14890 [Halobaculum sp. CBA1158]|uniref:hypothetical protein n=1 Tax=Halobaculum sp. CBA1158 TaxID=2904243 RepID=UPI001F3F83FF|nr:hypothetical protein [Halobaculum sp. CBA1158]UIO99787.1 hypothetical protein Hbl1158_14890 [Halobaculum sp. CBA1158]